MRSNMMTDTGILKASYVTKHHIDVRGIKDVSFVKIILNSLEIINNNITLEVWKENLSGGLTIINRYNVISYVNTTKQKCLIGSHDYSFQCCDNVTAFEANDGLTHMILDILGDHLKEVKHGRKNNE